MTASDFDPGELEALTRLNGLRAANERDDLLEAHFAGRYAAEHRLAVYGTLAPGEPNHHHLSDLAGQWRAGTVNGSLEPLGWGADMGYPALRWSPDGAPVAVQMFVSDELPKHWARLDDFEGEQYLRILVPVRLADGGVAVANLYAAHPAATQ